MRRHHWQPPGTFNVAPKEDGQLEDVGLKGFCIVGTSFADILRQTTKRTPTVNIPWAPSFILRKTAPFTTPSVLMMRMLPVSAWSQDTARHTAWLHSTCNSCHRWTVADRLSELRNEYHPCTPGTSHFRCPPILKKLIASDAIVDIQFEMGCDSAIVPTYFALR